MYMEGVEELLNCSAKSLWCDVQLVRSGCASKVLRKAEPDFSACYAAGFNSEERSKTTKLERLTTSHAPSKGMCTSLSVPCTTGKDVICASTKP